MNRLLLILVVFFVGYQAFAQKHKMEIKKGKEVIEYVPENPIILPDNYREEILKIIQEKTFINYSVSDQTPF